MAAVKAKKPTSKKLRASKKRPLNKWLLLAGVAVVAIIGIVTVRMSSASSCPQGNYAFVRCLQQINSQGSARFIYNGRQYTLFGPGSVYSIANKAEISRARTLCAHIVNSGTKSVNFTLQQKVGSSIRTVATKSLPSKSTGNICGPKQLAGDSALIVFPSVSAGVGLDTIYGKR